MAWFWSSPVGAAPDEEAYYVRTVGISEGVLVGQPISVRRGSASPAALSFYEGVSRAIYVPTRLNPPDFAGCYATHSEVPATCAVKEPRPTSGAELLTYVGTYPPLPYAVPALLLRFAANPWAGVYLGRLGVGGVSLGLLILALLAIGYGRRESVAIWGLLLGATPMVVFLAVSESASGIEAAAALCFLVALIRLRAHPAGPPAVVVVVSLAAGGFALAVARPLGPLWIAASLIGYAIAGGHPSPHAA
ncbi:MAG TPA: DUF2142 domain-containing protein, partial [Chloroflexota bacterium]|nr:DUF2142 domain-containing protein [Chloroflexota bacterium]